MNERTNQRESYTHCMCSAWCKSQKFFGRSLRRPVLSNEHQLCVVCVPVLALSIRQFGGLHVFVCACVSVCVWNMWYSSMLLHTSRAHTYTLAIHTCCRCDESVNHLVGHATAAMETVHLNFNWKRLKVHQQQLTKIAYAETGQQSTVVYIGQEQK